MATRILSIAYDVSLSRTRRLLLENEGYVVTSATEFDEAVRLCRTESFDLVVVGHCFPDERQQQHLITELRSVCSTPLLALRCWEGPGQGADVYAYVADGPAALIAAVKKMLARNAKAA